MCKPSSPLLSLQFILPHWHSSSIDSLLPVIANKAAPVGSTQREFKHGEQIRQRLQQLPNGTKCLIEKLDKRNKIKKFTIKQLIWVLLFPIESIGFSKLIRLTQSSLAKRTAPKMSKHSSSSRTFDYPYPNQRAKDLLPIYLAVLSSSKASSASQSFLRLLNLNINLK